MPDAPLGLPHQVESSASASVPKPPGGFGGVLLARIVLGIAEAPTFPGNAKATG